MRVLIDNIENELVCENPVWTDEGEVLYDPGERQTTVIARDWISQLTREGEQLIKQVDRYQAREIKRREVRYAEEQIKMKEKEKEKK
ncbi:MAG: hypothetical protein J6S27_03790 [Thermoguttaceae bacterium]|nr:hypothetical protein [Thermoguttaceae bacterium]